MTMTLPRVILADDDEELRGALAGALERSGYDVVPLEDGAELSDYFELIHPPSVRQHQPDLVITDVRMPGRSGLEVMRQARLLGLTCPVILFTAWGDDTVRETAHRMGQTVVVDKPAEHHAVLRQVRELLCPTPVADRPRVLVVEDDEDLRGLICGALRAGGFTVEEGRDGLGLNARLLADPRESPRLDLVITDERMPWSSGLDILERLKQLGWKPNFILITSQTERATRDRAHRLGAHSVLIKPFVLRELVEAARAATRKKR
jgi:DNA-binding response OmpR family regulator